MGELIKRHEIIVVAHRNASQPKLRQPYKEVCIYYNEIKPQGFTNYISGKESSLKFPNAWSEVAVLLETRIFSADCSLVGFQHYRRFFNFNYQRQESNISMLPKRRNGFVESQLHFLDQITDCIVVPQKKVFDESSWDQFVKGHSDLEELMNVSCLEFDALLKPIFGEVSSKQLLQNTQYLYPYNMFLGKVEFYLEWRGVLSQLVERIENTALSFEANLSPRWGGYIIERLFSVYIMLCIRDNKWEFTEKPVVIFDAFTFRQKPLLRIRQIIASIRATKTPIGLAKKLFFKYKNRATTS